MDFRRLFESGPGCSLVVDPQLRVVAANDAYLAATTTRRQDVIGRSIFEVLGDDLARDLAGGETGVTELQRSLDRVRRSGTPDTMAVQAHDRRGLASDGGGPGVGYASRTNTPVTGEDGDVAYILHTVQDVTAFVHLDLPRRDTGEPGGPPSPKGDFDLDEVVSGVIDLWLTSALNKGVTLRSDVAADLSVRAWGDAPAIGQVLTTLVGNAVRFTHAGAIAVGVTAVEGKARFSVTDTGVGIDPVDRPGLLQDGRGSGRGLAMCAWLVESMGSVLECGSRLGRGTTFWFDISLAQAHSVAPVHHAAPAPSAMLPPDAPDDARSTGLRVLLADDAEINRVVGVALLEGLGHRVDVVADGAAALAAIRQTSYAAVLMDCVMPVMDGYDATARVRRLEGAAAHTPIIATTASAMVGDRERCLAAGMDDYLSKPLNPTALAAALARSHPRLHPGAAELVADGEGPAGQDAGDDSELMEGLERLEEAIGPEAYGEVRASFLGTGPALVDELADAVAAGDAEGTRRLAHALKGSMANLGAGRLSRVAARLEHPDDTDEPAAVIGEVRREFGRVHDVLSRPAGGNRTSVATEPSCR
jgi:CheY-like chemotaxis protein/HPt (histidine-containing phosphotransfer) domain-containing protein